MLKILAAYLSGAPFQPGALRTTVNILHRVSKKLCKHIFCQTFAKFRRIINIFGTKIAERTGFSVVYSFFTSPNLCLHTTV